MNTGRHGRLRAAAAVCLLSLATVAFACSGDDDEQPDTTATSGSGGTSPGALTGAGGTTATPTGRSEQSAPETPTPSPTTAAEQSANDPLSVVLKDVGAVTGSDCSKPENADKPCVTLSSDESTLRGGIATFGIATRAGGGYVAVYGRLANGRWAAWERTQSTFLLLRLPGEVRVCADGDNLNVRAEPRLDAPIVGGLEDDVIATATEFVLDTPRSGDERGFGWYRLTAPLAGWAHSEFLTNAAESNCALRDAQVD